MYLILNHWRGLKSCATCEFPYFHENRDVEAPILLQFFYTNIINLMKGVANIILYITGENKKQETKLFISKVKLF